nr:O-antigen ligase family protein [Hydrogenophilus thiooxidans]
MPLLLATGWVVLLSGARSALVLLTLAALPVVWLWPRRFLVGLLAALVVGIGAAIALSPAWQSRAANTLQGVAALFQAHDAAQIEAGLNAILTQRWELWRNAFRMGAAHPFLGVGAKQFRAVYPDYANTEDLFRTADPYHAHHLYLALWAELGASGLLWVLAMAGAAAVAYRRAPPEAKARAAPWGAALAAYAFPLQSQPVLLNIWWFPVVWFCWVGFWLALREEALTTSAA